jgi:hypothetical protein
MEEYAHFGVTGTLFNRILRFNAFVSCFSIRSYINKIPSIKSLVAIPRSHFHFAFACTGTEEVALPF